MEQFWKASVLILLTVIFGLVVGKTERDLSLLLSIAACCIVGGIIIYYLEPVFDLLWELNSFGNIQNDIFGILLKIAGISLIAELSQTICNDAGNNSLGKILQMLGSAAILCLSVPIFSMLLTLIRDILREL